MRIVRLLFVLFLASVASAAELTNPTYGPSPYTRGAAAVASNGKGFLTLWTMVLNDSTSNVYGSLADAGGNVVTPVSFLVAPNASVETLFANGDGYIAIFTRDKHSQIAYLASNGRVVQYGATFPDLQVASPFMFDPARISSRAFNGHEFFTVYQTGSTFPPAVTLGQVMRIDGTLVRNDVPISSWWKARVAATADGFVVLLSENDKILFLQRFTTDGAPVGSRQTVATLTTGAIYDLAIASSGTETAVMWTERTSDAPEFKAHVRVISGDAAHGADRTATGPWGIQILWTGTKFVFWYPNQIGSIGRAGTIIDEPVAADAFGSAAVLDGKLRVASAQQAGVIGYSIDVDTLKRTEPVTLSITLRRQIDPLLAFSRAGMLAVWFDQRADGTTIAAMPLRLDGTPLRSDQIDVGTASTAFYVSPTASVAFGSNVYLVVWRQANGDIVARRIDVTGNPLDAQPLLIQKNGLVGDQSVAWTGKAFLVVSFTYDAGNVASLISETGEVTPLGSMSSSGWPAVVASNGSQTLVGWPIYSPCNVSACVTAPVAVSFVRVSSDGKRIDATPTTVDTGNAYHLATSGREFVLVTDSYGSRVDIRTVSADGPAITVTKPVAVFPAVSTGPLWMSLSNSNVIWDGMHYVVAWRYGIADHQWIGLARFDRSLNKIAALYADAAAVDMRDTPALAPAVPGDVLLLFSRVLAANGGVSRLWSMREHEMQQTPAPPPAPLITKATGSPSMMSIDWAMAPVPVEAFMIERVNPFTGAVPERTFFPGDARHAEIQTPRIYYVTPSDLYVQMRAFNAGGVSESTAATKLMAPARKRAAGH